MAFLSQTRETMPLSQKDYWSKAAAPPDGAFLVESLGQKNKLRD
jgi:hypothetical protein